MRARLAASVLAGALAGVLAAPASAQTYEVLLGGGPLGTLAYAAGEEGAASLDAAFAGTPLGVFDGTFAGTSRPALTAAGEVVTQYLGVTASTRKSRTVSVLHAGGSAVETVVSPAEEATALSAANAAPAGFVDPVQGFGLLAGAGGACPEPVRIYDGRRAVEIAVRSSETLDGRLLCHAGYRVVAGPAHLEPLGIAAFDVDLAYDAAGLGEVVIRTGPFEVRLVR